MKRVIGRLNPQDKSVNIWGAGFSGLVLGYYLKELGYKVTIFERSHKVGGKIHTKKTPNGLVETGPNALYMNADGMDLLKHLKLTPLPASKKLKRFLMINGKLQRPMQLSVLSKIALNAHKKPPLISDGLTVADFFRPLIGEANIQNFLSPALGGIYATPAENLHFKSVFHDLSSVAQFDSYWDMFGLLLKIKKTKPRLEISGSVSFEGGMQTFINRLAEHLSAEIKLGHKESFKIKGNTIICTDALAAAELLKELRPEFSTELSRIKYQPLCSTTVFTKHEIKPIQKAFGVLMPLNNGVNSIGILNNKAIFPANNENVYSYTFISRNKCTEKQIKEDIKSIAPSFNPEDIEHMEVNHWDTAIPVYDIQRHLSIKKLHLLGKKEENLAIFGNYVAGISLREMISAAKDFAQNPTDYKEN